MMTNSDIHTLNINSVRALKIGICLLNWQKAIFKVNQADSHDHYNELEKITDINF